MSKLSEKIYKMIDELATRHNDPWDKGNYRGAWTDGASVIANELWQEIERLRGALISLNDACDGEIGCWCGNIIRGELVDVCPRCNGESMVAASIERFGESKKGDEIGYHGHKYSCPAPAYTCTCQEKPKKESK